MPPKPTNQDFKFIQECIKLSRQALAKGDKPFGALVTKDGEIVASSANNSNSKVYEHAELLALDAAAKKLGQIDLTGCTLYSNCEPCPSCSFFTREYHISRLVYAIPSPGMGGVSRWPIVEDEGLSGIKPFFGNVPEVIGGILEKEALEVFRGTGLEKYFGSDKK